MELILTNTDGKELRNLQEASIDLDLNDTYDFQLTINRSDWKDDIVTGCRVFRPGTEYGGLIRRRGTDTKEDVVTPGGYTWRGMLKKKIIEPPAGEDYRIVSGEIHEVMRSLIEPEFPGLFVVPEVGTGVSVSQFQFDRYCTLHDGIQKMLQSVGYRLDISYIQQERGASGFVQVSAAEIEDYSDQVELSNDNRLNFTASTRQDGVNHLICLGKGELKDRTVIHLFAQLDGSIGTEQYYTGIDEIAETYESSGAELEDLEAGGRERLAGLMNQETFSMDIASLGLEVEIGDIIGGRDYLTGIYVKKPVAGKIWTYDNGVESIEYKIEGES